MVSAIQFLSTTAAITLSLKLSATVPLVMMVAAASGVSYESDSTEHVRMIKSPAGGVMQFKGLTQTTANDAYVQVVCRGVMPVLQGATAWRNLSNSSPTTETNGFLVSCMTGISQCAVSNLV